MADSTPPQERLDAVSLWQILAGSAVLVSGLHAALVLGTGQWDLRAVIALGLAGVCLLLAARSLRTRDSRLLAVVLILLVGQLALFVARLAGATPPFRLPLLQVAIALASLAALLAAVLGGTRITKPINAALLSVSLAVGLFLAETGLQLFSHPPARDPDIPEWVGRTDAHPILGRIQAPHSVLTSYYPDNPRGYFHEEDDRTAVWNLEVQKGSIASLEFPPELREGVRVSIEKTHADTAWLIQLEQPHFRVERGTAYSIRFQARADRARKADVVLSQAHPPWNGLGLYRTIELTPEWQSFQLDFTTTAADSDAGIHLNLAASDAPVEVSALGLRGPGDRVIAPALPPKRFLVRYAFNALGCRSRDYPLRRADGTTRILVLGDSYTFGIGVHQDDTFSAQLERELMQQDSAKSAGARRTYEVINCGVSGYATREERLFYELYGAQYRPDIVLVMMVFNDDMSWLEEVQKGYAARRPGKLELLFHDLGKVQEYRYRRVFDYTKSVKELLELDREVRQQGARLAVASFGSDPDPAKDELTQTVRKGLAGTNVPLLDLGKALNAYTPAEGLRVHKFDAHPNEIAHTIVARELLTFLREKGLLAP